MNRLKRLTLVLLWCSAAVEASTLYSVTDIGPTASISQVNNHGQVVGTAGAFSFIYDGTLHPIPNPPGGLFGASGINNSGQVIGTVAYPSYQYAAGLYANGALQVFGSGSIVSATEINDTGLIAGDYQYRAVSYSNGTFTDLGVLPGDLIATTRGINNAGSILILSSDGSSGHAAIYSNGLLTAVPGSEGLNVQPSGINNLGQVVGYVSTGTSTSPLEAVLLSNGQATLLGQLGTPTAGTFLSFADAINDSGVIVGIGYTPAGYRAWVYDHETGMVDLNSLLTNGSGWSLEVARSINDAGQIVGEGFYNGVRSGFFLTPVAIPEPPPAAATFLGLLCLGVGLGLRLSAISLPRLETEINPLGVRPNRSDITEATRS